MNTGVGRN